MSKKILVVDDDPQILDIVKVFLEQGGFIVKLCADGLTAIDELHADHFDLMILDINMPIISGFKSLNRVRANPVTKNIPVIMLTINRSANDVIKASKYNVTDFVIKPPVREELLKRIEKALNNINKELKSG